jgi:hypothetical protein
MSVKSQFPTAQIWEEMGRLAHKRYFALLDLKRAFNQCLVSPPTRDLLTFVTMNGTYSFLHVPFGPTNVPGWFRSIFARTVLEGMDQIVCEVFVDDVAIHGTTWEEFLDNLRAVVMRLAQHNVHCGAPKCHVGYDYIKYVGHLINFDGIRLTDDRKKSVMDTPPPTTK